VIATRRPTAIDAALVRSMERLLHDGSFPAAATHGPARTFRMPSGVRRNAQAEQTVDGGGVRVSIPLCAGWYARFTRRIAERPATTLRVQLQFASC
jgi:hypothetical protein